MKTKRKDPEIFVEEKKDNKEPEQTTETKTRERFQLSFDLKEDGTPDLAGMRESTKARVQQFFSDSRMASAFGAKPPVVQAQVFHPSMVAGLYALLGAAESMAMVRIAKVPEPIAKRVFTYTPPEVELLTGPTVRVLNKYAADWMIKYQDEIALATILGTLTIQKVQLAYAMAKARDWPVDEMPNVQGGEGQAKTNGKEGVDPGTPN